jgi:hypothetical protein
LVGTRKIEALRGWDDRQRPSRENES